MDVELKVTVEDTYYAPAEPSVGFPGDLFIEGISFSYDGIQVKTLAELEELILQNEQDALIKEFETRDD